MLLDPVLRLVFPLLTLQLSSSLSLSLSLSLLSLLRVELLGVQLDRVEAPSWPCRGCWKRGDMYPRGVPMQARRVSSSSDEEDEEEDDEEEATGWSCCGDLDLGGLEDL